MVDPTRPQWEYKGAHRQEWQRLHASEQRLRANDKAARVSNSRSSVRSSSGSSPSFPTYSSGESSDGVSSGGGNVIAEAVVGLAFWIVGRLWPLKALAKLAERLCGVGPKARMVTAVPCALIGAGVALGHDGHDVALGLVGLALGGGIGWAVPTVLGLALALAAMLTGLAIGLALIAAALGLAYVIFEALAH